MGIFEIFDDNAMREANTKFCTNNQKAPNEVALETREYLFGHKKFFFFEFLVTTFWEREQIKRVKPEQNKG